ncbi:MAG TPA: formylglycine-generating enzyme family protein [Anaerolineales bacterium]|nr:formylglycine-generating enzyme family protein [Anaerolineales bacterium]
MAEYSPLQIEFIQIPAGPMVMGSNSTLDHAAQIDEFPAHELEITDFYIGRFPVTNAQYRQFVAESGQRPPLFWKDGQLPAGKEDHPVVGVSLNDVLQFCAWARTRTGLPVRLPTEAEWEKAARGPQGNIYPWGSQWEAGRCNSREARLDSTSPVGQFSPAGDSPYGVADLGGNVQEWLISIFGPYPYDPTDGREELVHVEGEVPRFPQIYETGGTSLPESMEAALGKATMRGGSYRLKKTECRCAYRSWAAPMHRSDDTGFRVCYEP